MWLVKRIFFIMLFFSVCWNLFNSVFSVCLWFGVILFVVVIIVIFFRVVWIVLIFSKFFSEIFGIINVCVGVIVKVLEEISFNRVLCIGVILMFNFWVIFLVISFVSGFNVLIDNWCFNWFLICVVRFICCVFFVFGIFFFLFFGRIIL